MEKIREEAATMLITVESTPLEQLPTSLYNLIYDIFKEVEQDRFPPLDAWSRRAMIKVLEAITSTGDLKSGYLELEPDVYWDDLIDWLGGNPSQRAAFIEEAIKNLGTDAHFFEILRTAQLYELELLYFAVLDALEKM